MVKEQGRRKKSKAPKAKLTQAMQRALVTGEDAAKRYPKHDREEIKLRLNREEKNLRRDVPSEPWFDAKWYGGEQFPPGGDVTGMERCRCCDHYMPPNCMSARGVCLDCQYAGLSRMVLETLPSSHSSVNLAKLKASRKKFGNPYAGGL